MKVNRVMIITAEVPCCLLVVPLRMGIPILYCVVTKVGDGKSLDVFGTFERKTLFGTTRDEIDNCTPEDTKSTVMSYSAEFWSPLIAVSSRLGHSHNARMGKRGLVLCSSYGSGTLRTGTAEPPAIERRGFPGSRIRRHRAEIFSPIIVAHSSCTATIKNLRTPVALALSGLLVFGAIVLHNSAKQVEGDDGDEGLHKQGAGLALSERDYNLRMVDEVKRKSDARRCREDSARIPHYERITTDSHGDGTTRSRTVKLAWTIGKPEGGVGKITNKSRHMPSTNRDRYPPFSARTMHRNKEQAEVALLVVQVVVCIRTLFNLTGPGTVSIELCFFVIGSIQDKDKLAFRTYWPSWALSQ
ncbi:hypothetical protein EI94DRAFT_1785827 [Lactarius quietus]|nr:hypothetical protein EI94DRAFT_1785827 [Lactarius quietus]